LSIQGSKGNIAANLIGFAAETSEVAIAGMDLAKERFYKTFVSSQKNGKYGSFVEQR
jgi:hypothetical protein